MLFKITTTPLPANLTIKDTEFKQFFPSVNKNMDWNSLSPYVQQAEDCEIIPAIGQSFYNQLQSEYDSNGNIADATVAKTFRLLRTALAYYAIYYALPQLNLRVGDAGASETSSSDVQPTRQWVFNLSRWETLRTGSKYLDMALEHMESQVQANNSDYDAFKNNNAYTVFKELLIPTASVFQKFYNIENSRISYKKLAPYIAKAEQRYLQPLLSDFFDELKSQHTSNTLNTANNAILPAVQRLLAEYTVILAIPDLNFVNDGAGWRIIENPNANPMQQQQAIAAVQQLHTKAEQNAAHFEIELKNILYADLDNYPTYQNSDANELLHDDDEDGVADSDEVHKLPPGTGAVIL